MSTTPIQRTIPAYSIHEQELQRGSTAHNTLHVNEGSQFTITLHGNAGTGYTWYIQEPSEDYITLIAKHIIPCRHPGGRITTVFKFHAMQAGHETMIFEYARPWNWAVAQKVVYEIIITPRTQAPLRPHPVLR